MSADEKRIREFAYRIWESEGRPNGHEQRHWEMARKLAEAEALAPDKSAVRSASQPKLPKIEGAEAAKPAATKAAAAKPAVKAAPKAAGKPAAGKAATAKPAPAAAPKTEQPAKPAAVKKPRKPATS